MSDNRGHKHLLVVYHSQSGRNERLACAARDGALADNEVEVRLRRAMEADINDLLWCDGLILSTPENFGYLSGGMKDFFDRTFYPAASQQLNLPYMLIIGCGNDGTGALRQLERIVKGYPLQRVAEVLIVHGDPSEDELAAAKELGMAMAAGLSMGIF